MLTPALVSFTAAPASAASVTGASFTAGGVVRDGVRYAKTGDVLTLTVTTDNTTQCVEITGAATTAAQSTTNKTSWSIPITAGAGNGVQTVTATAYRKAHPSQNHCIAEGGESFGTFPASFTLDNDNTGPLVTSALNPLPNAAGWNKSDVAITWSATDPSGVKSITPTTDSVTTNTTKDGVTKTTVAKDQLDNATTGSVLVKLDEDAPVVTPSRTPAANTHGWNNTDVTASFTTSDELSGVDTQAAGKVFDEGANQSHTGTGTDVAGNSASATVSGVNVDKTNPTLSGAPTTQHNGSGWYKDDVVVAWTAADALSGLAAAAPGNSTITGSGEGLTASQTVTDKAGNSTTASSPAVKIDRTAPTTNATAPAGWNTTDQTVTLSPSDTGSGVASTRYKVGNGDEQTGTSVAFTTDGQHELTYWSVDRAGNAEAPKTVTVKVDKSAPSIFASQSPAAVNGWNNSNVTVTFRCEDAGSGIASCSPSAVISEEGRAKTATGTATDNAGNTATATQTVNLDKTPPDVTGSRVPAGGNTHGWNNTDVVASFTTTDALSGVATSATGKTFGHGADQSVTGTGTDAAGNTASATVGGVNVDKTDPTLSGTPSTTGWSRGDVTVTWVANDDLSGLDGAVPTPTVVDGEGDDRSATASVSDKAGNTTATTVSGIKIDRTAPNTTASVGERPLASGWYDQNVTVTLAAVDNLSDVAKTYYRVGTGAAQEYSGPFAHTTLGVSTITYWSVDGAGHVEDEKSLTLKVDGTAPATSISLPQGFTTGWNGTEVPVAFAATDAESGVKTTSYSLDGGPVTVWDGKLIVLLDGTHTVKFWSEDVAGNVEDNTAAANTYTIKVDTVPPTITGSRLPVANSHGWNNGPVTVSFKCTDATSGLAAAGCTNDTLLENENEKADVAQSVTGTALDNADHTATTTVGGIYIDKTAPTLKGEATTDANGAGWYKGDVAIKWVGADGLSGLDASTQPANSTITGEGDNLGAGPVTIKDKAGNTSAAASVSGIKIDRTAPVITGGPTTQPNTAGWYKSSVVVDFSCTDNLSGVAFCPTSKQLDENGANQTFTSDKARDKAGNETATGKTVGGINIDAAAPSTTADITCGKPTQKICNSAKTTVKLDATDQAGLSGVDKLLYRTNTTDDFTAITGSTGSFDLTFSRSGKMTVQFKAVDKAGNEEAVNSIEVKYDTVAPTVTHTKSPAANAGGWNDADTTVTFAAEDDSDGSGVDPATVTKPVTVSTETAGIAIAGEAYDLAGNKGTDSATVRLDKTKPTITAAITAGTKTASGWYNGPVTVSFTCDDKLSGVATCPDPVVLTGNGPNAASGTVTDKAGLTASDGISGINIDQEKPTLTTADVNVAGQSYTLGTVPTATCTATDSFSGVESCTVKVSGGNTNGTGTFTYTATATDKVGNTTTVTGSFTVIYKFDGFLQPINDTAHQVGLNTSIFKAGSTIPVKLQVKDAAGQVVALTTAPLWAGVVKGSATTAPVDETAYTVTATTGSAYTLDSTNQQWQYNWSTKGQAAGYYYRIGAKLDDGQVYYVNIGLR